MELSDSWRSKYESVLREKQQLEDEVDNSEQMKKAVFTDLEMLSQQNKRLEIDNDALRS